LKVLATNQNLKHIGDVAKVLRITLFLYVVAFCLKLKKGAVISSVLVVENGLSEQFSFWIEKNIAILLLLCLLGMFFKATYKLSSVVITFFLISYSLLTYFNGGKAFLELALISAISKWWLPVLTLYAFSCIYNRQQYLNRWFTVAIQFSIFLIFVAHGVGCFLKNGIYVDYIIGFVRDYTPFSIKQGDAEALLNVIGIIDILVAVLVLIKPFKYLLYWLIFWGFLTSLLRIVDASILNYVEFLMRVPHFGLPLVLLLAYKHKIKSDHHSSDPNPSLSKS